VRIARDLFGRQADTLEQIGDAVLQLRPLGEAVDHQRFTHQVADAHARIQ
jgi:hypothetical protein